MTSPFDESDFIDRDLQASQRAQATTTLSGGVGNPHGASPLMPRPPTREELESRVGETQSRIAELKRAQQELERERVHLEEARRRRSEFESGRTEILERLTRGVAILEEAEFKTRRDAEQLAKTLAEFKDALSKVQAINEKGWTQESWNSELTRALTTVDNARMEWNTARQKWALLDGQAPNAEAESDAAGNRPSRLELGGQHDFGELCRLGFALTWPVAVVGLLTAVALLVILLQR